MALVQWNPFRELDELLNRMYRPAGAVRGVTAEAWAPQVDISETPKEYMVKVDLPGVSKDDVKINVDHGVLTISGERKSSHEDKDARVHRIERSFGAYSRSFALPEDVVQEQITADSKDGILAVHLPKTEVKKPSARQITVQ
jgi:HSP20 family protein